MFQSKQKVMIGAIVATIVLAWWFRYDFVTTNQGATLVRDRWLQTIDVCYGRYNCWQLFPALERPNNLAEKERPSNLSATEAFKYLDDLTKGTETDR